MTQQYPSHLLAHPQTPHCERRKQFDTAQAFFSNRKRWQDQSNPTSKAESAEACLSGLCLFLHRWRFYSLSAQPIEWWLLWKFDYFHSKKKNSVMFRWNYFFCSLSGPALIVITTEKSLSPFSFSLIQFLSTLIKSLLSLLFSRAELKFSQSLS